jgi:multiple sugar transport system permease protein
MSQEMVAKGLPVDTPSRRLRVLRSWRRNRFAYALVLPALVFMLAVHIAPTAAGLYVAFLDVNLFTFHLLFRAPWVGLENFRAILFETDNPLRPGFIDAVRNTISYTAWTVGVTLSAGLGIALLLHRQFPGRRIARTLMIAPWVVPSFVAALLWQFMWQSDTGIINRVLVDYLHLLDERPIWLLGENSIWAIIVPTIWRGLPFVILVFLAGLQAIPSELYEAAAIDGAGPWQRFRHITLPLLRPLIAIQLLFGVIYAAYQFSIPFVMLGSNPGPYADLLMTLIVRQAFTNQLIGYGAAISTLMMIAMLLWVAVWYRAFRRDLVAAA